MNMRKMVDKLTIDFIERFRKAKSRCLVQLLEVECAAMAAMAIKISSYLANSYEFTSPLTLCELTLE